MAPRPLGGKRRIPVNARFTVSLQVVVIDDVVPVVPIIGSNTTPAPSLTLVELSVELTWLAVTSPPLSISYCTNGETVYRSTSSTTGGVVPALSAEVWSPSSTTTTVFLLLLLLLK